MKCVNLPHVFMTRNCNGCGMFCLTENGQEMAWLIAGHFCIVQQIMFP